MTVPNPDFLDAAKGPIGDFRRRLEVLLKTTPTPVQAITTLTTVLDAYLQERIEPRGEVLALTLETLRDLLGPRGQGHCVLAQINPTPGDLSGNAQKIIGYLSLAETIGVDMVIFPELALMGYPMRDIISRHPFLVTENLKWLETIATKTRKTRALVGFVEPRLHALPYQSVRGKPFYNAVAILGEGQIEGIVRKSLLPDYNEFEDSRTFEPSRETGVQPAYGLSFCDWEPANMTERRQLQTIHQHRYGISICEDTWNDVDFFHRPLYEKDPLMALDEDGPECLINVSSSPTRSRKEQLKHQLLSHLAKKYQIPYIYVNQVGAVDEVSFDGTSRVYNASGDLLARAKAFEEQFLIVNPSWPSGPIYPLPEGLEKTYGTLKCFDAYDTQDLSRTYETILQGIRDYFKKTRFEKAVLGLSGGLDSSVVATLLADALGSQNVLGVLLPSSFTPSDNETDALQLARNLGIHGVRIPIAQAKEAFVEGFERIEPQVTEIWGSPIGMPVALENIQARTRAVWLWMIGNIYHAFPIATSDKSELYLGYATVHGDMAGSLAPLGDVPKTKVRLLARWLNENRSQQNVIPESVIIRPSGADLAIDPQTGQTVTAESALMPYEFADEAIWRIEALQQSQAQMLHSPFQWEKTHEVSTEEKAQWLDRFFNRMSRAVFKWWVSPPIIMVEGYGSIAKTDYHHPITACRIDWRENSLEQIERILDQASEGLVNICNSDNND